MTVSARHPIYRALIRLYPREFRVHYGDELEQTFHDIVTDRGVLTASTRAGLDVLLTLPRHHLERIMTQGRTDTMLIITIALVVAAGIAVTIDGAMLGGALLAVAIGFAAIQRTNLARSLRVAQLNRRRRRFVTAAWLAGLFAACYALFLVTIGDSWGTTETVLAVIGQGALVGSFGFLLAGLFTSRAPKIAPAPTGDNPAAA